MKQEKQVRKPLRQRVADRKRGIKEATPMTARKKRMLKHLRFFLTVSQYLGLLLLLLSLGTIVTNNYQVQNWDMIVIYSAMFIIGRGGLTLMKSIQSFK
ncbi:hypothetical protein [Pseudemcibacter aquimaris]|uniref:hypothetical protein n=1 Tax=Pseudemcibacter aquimaris TaxID=2857064 RepID=UPI00201346B6|nr:hypothetical protein [Pseudemcibacter aquimaris]MCC3861432.1 hypothetical protein [Pseudemcibacter aquimaris]WDU58201.1 hypothetical protein KW060_13495 [Pseudemcibacter aquimaris]